MIHNGITVLVFQFSSVSKCFVGQVSIAISSVFHLTSYMVMKKTAWIEQSLRRKKAAHERAA